MADLPIFEGSVRASTPLDWELVPAVVAGTWLWQNAGKHEMRVMITDGAAPTDTTQGEILASGEWTPFQVLMGAGEALYVLGRNSRVFLRQFA